MKQECQRCDKKIEVGKIPKMFCPKCVDEVIEHNMINAKKEVFNDLKQLCIWKYKQDEEHFVKCLLMKDIEEIEKRHLSTN